VDADALEQADIALALPWGVPAWPGARSGRRAARWAKRALDVVVAAVALLVLAPLCAVIALAVVLDSPGPALFRQRRVGQHGRPFVMYKFRSMVDGAEEQLAAVRHLNSHRGPVFKARDDPRVTRMGRWLRRSSLDELPQLLNVLRGEMSLVGPRPPLPAEVAHYTAREWRRLAVRPGMTCLWQINGRSEVGFEEWVEMDLAYIERWSLWLDLAILLRTLPAVVSGRGAY